MKVYAPPDIQTVTSALALENLLLEDPAGEEGVLFCWSGERSVVMGKNQNPWKECNLDFIRSRSCKLARRVSGGGAVYHDPGNLNISWILPREEYRAEKIHGLLLRSLSTVGIEADMGTGGSLTVDGKKISGSAFCYRKDRVLHHGTLLLDADLGELRSALSPSRFRLKTHAVASLPAPVVNLKQLKPEVKKAQIQESLFMEAETCFGALKRVENLLPEERVDAEAARLGADEWIWDMTPGFYSQISLPGDKTLHFRVHKGKLQECRRGDTLIDLEEAPHFPDGDFGELEIQLGLSSGDLTKRVHDAGWVKV